jgi:hypothetical protein
VLGGTLAHNPRLDPVETVVEGPGFAAGDAAIGRLIPYSSLSGKG